MSKGSDSDQLKFKTGNKKLSSNSDNNKEQSFETDQKLS